MAFVILTGASGSGKTSIAEAVATRHGAGVDVYHFDRIGIPPIEQMIAEHGSGEAWQRAKTFWWMSELAAKRSAGRSLLFEGQTRLAFLRQAAAAANVTDYMHPGGLRRCGEGAAPDHGARRG
jgi:predicted ATPase